MNITEHARCSTEVWHHACLSWCSSGRCDTRREASHAQVRVVVPPGASSSGQSRTAMYVMAQIREVITREPGIYRCKSSQ